ncbi:hypothetical protein Noda2021_06640 [Candidatus Dependentiae bacterium Noda2021]|nr:hypothetical protein Noda2021_06640 [Candidatus Dependentiae bacterium Noda2021]
MKHKTFSLIRFVLVLGIIASSDKCAADTFVDKCKNLYKSVIPQKKCTDSTTQEYTVSKQSKIIIQNDHGSINIKTEWNQNKVFLKATKAASTQEKLAHIQIKAQLTNDSILIQPVCSKQEGDWRVDMELIVPTALALHVTTEQGDIKAKSLHSEAYLTTTLGDIEVDKAHQKLVAHSKEKGKILINHAENTVKATTYYGDITIADAQRSVLAQSHSGKIELYCNQVPSTSIIDLNTTHGNIITHLPKDTNARINAHTKKGTFLCKHFITLNPFTTKLDVNAWKQFKKGADGVLGSGEAQITLNSINSNIKVLEREIS